MPARDLYLAQQRLLELGYYAGQPDGQPGSRTRAAIRQYQSDNGFAATGELSRGEFQQLVQGGSNSPAQSPDGEPQLSRNEMADMQRGLAALGFDVGAADGAAGTRTGRAISRFLSDRGYDPYQTPVHVARQLVLEEAGLAAGASEQVAADEARPQAEDAAMDPSETYISRAGSSSANNPDDAALDRAFGRRMIGADPTLFDDANVSISWLRSMGQNRSGNWSTPEAKALHERFEKGTEFDRQAIAKEFATYLATQGTNAPMRMTSIRPLGFGTYDFTSKSFPLRVSEDLGARMMFFGPGVSRLTLEVENWDLPKSLAVPENEAQALATKLDQTRAAHIVIQYRLAAFSAEKERDNDTMFYAKAVVERISLHRRNHLKPTELGELLRDLPVTAPAAASDEPETSTPAANSLESWVRLGLPSRDGRVLLLASGYQTDAKVQRALELLEVAHLPSKPKLLRTAFTYAQKFTTPDQLRSVFPVGRNTQSYLYSLNDDPFRQKELVDKFNAVLLPKIVAKAPLVPAKLRVSMPLEVRGYDIEKQLFEIQAEYSGPIRSFDTNLLARPHYQLKVPAQTARKVIAQTRKDPSKRLHLAFDLDLQSVDVDMREESGSTRSTLSATVTAVALYNDAALSERVMQLPLSEYVTREPTLAGRALPKGTYLNRWNVAAMTAAMIGDPALGRSLVEKSEFVRRENEFGRDDAINRGMQKLAESRLETSGPLYLMGTMRLGEYQGTAFTVVNQGFMVVVEPDIEQLDSGMTVVAAENSDAITSFALERATAEKLVQDYPSREFKVVYRIRPVRAEAVANGQSIARLDLFIEETFLMDAKQPDRVLFSAKSKGGEPEAKSASLETIPERLSLNAESTLLLFAKHGGGTLDDKTLKQMLAMRWEEEKRNGAYDVVNTDVAPWGRFFPKNYRALTESDVERLLPKFRSWTEERVRTLPDKLVLEIVHNSGEGYRFGAPAQNYNDLLSKVGIDLRAFSSHRGWMFDDPEPDGSGGWKRHQSIIGLRPSNRYDDRVDVYMPLPELPSLPRESFARAISLDMDVRSAHSTPDAGDGRGAVVLDVVPTEVRWYGDRSAVTPRSLLKRFAIAPVAPREAVKDPSLDILGVSIGMTQSDAEAALRKSIKINRVLELKGDTADRTIIAESARMYVSEDGMDLVGILYGPLVLEPKVIGINRMYYAAPGKVTKGQVLAALEKKYGQLDNVANWQWGPTVGFGCGSQGMETINWSGAPAIEGKPLLATQITAQQLATDPVIGAEFLLMRRLEWVKWGFEAANNEVSQCKPSVSAEFQDSYRVGRAGENIPNADASILRTWLFDHAARRAALVQAQNAPRPEAASADIKL